MEINQSGMRRLVFRLWLSLGPLFLGVWLPYVNFSGTHYLNLPWSFIYGLGLLGQEAVFGRGINSPFNPFGMLLWPIVVTGFLYWLGGKLWRETRPSYRLVLVASVFVSGLFIADLSNPVSGTIPTYWWLTFEIW